MPKKHTKVKEKLTREEQKTNKRHIAYLDEWLKKTEERGNSLPDSHWNWILGFSTEETRCFKSYLKKYGEERLAKIIFFQNIAHNELERNEELRQRNFTHFELTHLVDPVRQFLSKALLNETDFLCKKYAELYLKILKQKHENHGDTCGILTSAKEEK